ncbi:MAG: tRNA (adenosine(37)-N6)-dimethylallyltransferase MiaA [bacterium]|nr:tRNA (adenosine(37)-N6)-dimethylallyltransferase MiaA [bacterium]
MTPPVAGEVPVCGNSHGFDLLVVLGPTASGKTRLGVALCRELNGEIISADSRQVYRGMDIGTGKDLEEYGDIPAHLLDIAEPGEEFNLFAFQRLCLQKIDEIRGRKRLPVIVGGTGLYIDAILRRYRLAEVPVNPDLRARLEKLDTETLAELLVQSHPAQHNTTDLCNRERILRALEIALGEANAPVLPDFPEMHPLVLGIRWQRETLRERIALRLRERLQQGMIEEVAGLAAKGVSFTVLERYGLEYRFVSWFLQGKLSHEEMYQQLLHAICDFSKRQMTWFRRMERLGVTIHWLDGENDPLAAARRIVEAAQEAPNNS